MRFWFDYVPGEQVRGCQFAQRRCSDRALWRVRSSTNWLLTAIFGAVQLARARVERTNGRGALLLSLAKILFFEFFTFFGFFFMIFLFLHDQTSKPTHFKLLTTCLQLGNEGNKAYLDERLPVEKPGHTCNQRPQPGFDRPNHHSQRHRQPQPQPQQHQPCAITTRQ